MKKSVVLSALAVAVLICSLARAETIYEHHFLGSDTDPLNGVGVDGGTGAGTPWVAESSWFADGHVTVGVDGFDAANAFLPFTPQMGKIYTLSATLITTADTANFMTLGYMNNPTVDLLSTDLGGPWILKRGQNNAVGADEVYTALNNLIGLESEGLFPGPTDFDIVLNTQLAQWTAEFLINGSSVRGPVNVSPTITHVGISRYVNPITGEASSFRLTSVPEPSSLMVLGIGILGFGLRLCKRGKAIS